MASVRPAFDIVPAELGLIPGGEPARIVCRSLETQDRKSGGREGQDRIFVARATAQEAAAVTAGATVYGNDGAEIGTVESIDGETAILVVDGMKAPVPAAAFGTGEQGATLNATKAQIVGMLQAAQQQAMAKRDAALVSRNGRSGRHGCPWYLAGDIGHRVHRL